MHPVEFVRSLRRPKLSPAPSQVDHESFTMQLARAIDKLPSKEKVVLHLSFFEDFGIDEIALALRLDEREAREILRRAVATLSERVADHMESCAD